MSLKWYKNKRGSIHNFDTWLEICGMAVEKGELDLLPLEYMNQKIKSGSLVEVQEASDLDLRRANYKILCVAEHLSHHLGIESMVEIVESNIKIYPLSKYPKEKMDYFQKMLDDYKKKVYLDFGIDF